jgi:hypothetical protein
VQDMRDGSHLLMTDGITATCVDCGGERLFVPAVDDHAPVGEFCCTACDAAVFLMPGRATHRRPLAGSDGPSTRREGRAAAVG